MLHLEYRNSLYDGSIIEIKPDSDCQIPGLRDMLEHNFLIENPAKTFAMKMKAGEYDYYPEDMVAEEAAMANALSEAWNWTGEEKGGQPVANVMMILCRLMQLYVEAVLEKE